MTFKVLVVDDSALMRKILSDIIKQDAKLEVCGTAHDGAQAIEMTRRLNPDIVTMDLEMPVMDGISALKEILKIKRLPIIMVSGFTQTGSQKTIEAMNAGAVDFILKPSSMMGDISLFSQELLGKINSNILAKVMNYAKQQTHAQLFNPSTKKILLIASSTGGPQTLEALLTALPKNIPVPILIVQHMPPMFTKSLADRLTKICEIEVREAKEGDELQKGVALIAPGDFHMELVQEFMGHEGSIKLNKKDREQGVRPCANVLFKSVAPIFRQNIICVVLTGMGADGTEGAKEIKKFNGTVIAQSEKDCIIFGMPKSIIDNNLADLVLDLDVMAVGLLQLLEI